MSLKCILQGQNDKSLKLDDSVLKQDNEDVTSQVKSALNAADATTVNGHITDTSIHVTAEEKAKIAKAVTTSGMVYNSALPAKPSAPIADGQEIPYSWDELNAIALSGKAADYVSVGAIKSVTLTSAVLGTTTHDVRIIGINQDNDQSITFQTKNCLNNTASFLNEKNICLNYYNAFSNKNIIKIVSKGICAEISTGSNRNGSVTYADETVWLPSEREMGLDSYSSISTANSTTSKAECTQGKNFAYNYYTSDSNRIKTLGDNTGTATRYLERSQNYNSMNLLCIVSTDGQAGGAYNNTLIGFAPAFVIGNGEPSKDTLIQDGEDVTDKVKEIVKPTVEEIGALALVTGNIYLHVSTTGNDATGDGSSSRPYRTIQHAVDAIPPVLNGHMVRIYVSPGIYEEDVQIVGKAGMSGYRPIEISGASDLDGAESYQIKSLYVAGVGMGTIAIKGFKFLGNATDGFDVYSYGNAAIRVDSCIMDAANDSGVSFNDRPFAIAQIINSTISNKKIVAVRAEHGCIVLVRACTGSNNAVAFAAGCTSGFGGCIVDCGNNSISATTAEIKRYGGQIFK